MNSTILREAGAGSDAFDSWLFSAALDDSLSDYVTTLGSHRRFLSPGSAVISHPTGPKKTPGKLQPWKTHEGTVSPGVAVAAAGRQHGLQLPLLMSPVAPPRPLLLLPSFKEGVLVLPWRMPASHAHHVGTFFRLFLAADPYFNELLRQPEGMAFKPDIPGSSRSVEVVLENERAVPAVVYALLWACNTEACSRSCIGKHTRA